MSKVDPFASVGSSETSELVDPLDLEVEWAVDEEHVAALAADIAECGRVLVPIMVWGPDRKIADGFHRVAAAQYVKEEWGYPETIPVKELDEPEWRFWEIRILSARQHERVETDRLLSWVYHCWRTGPWQAGNLINVLDALRLEVRRSRGRAVFSMLDLEDISEREFGELCDWIADKAQKWGIADLELCDAVVFQHVLKEWDLPPMQKRLVSRSIKECSLTGFRLVLDAWIRGKRIEGQGDYFDAASVVDAIVEKPGRAEHLAGATLRQFLRPPEVSAPVPRAVVVENAFRQFTRDCDVILHFLRTQSNLLLQTPSAKGYIQTLILEAIKLAAEIWSDPFAVWHKRLTLPEVAVTDEHMAIPSSVVEAKD